MIDINTFYAQLFTAVAFDSAKPVGSYFTIGEAVSVVALVIAAYQLVNPLIKARFDLRPKWLHWLPLFLLLISLVCCCVAALLPALTSLHKYWLSFAVFWEILAAIIAVLALAVSSKIALSTPKLKANNVAIWLGVLHKLMLKGTHEDFYVITQLLEAKSHHIAIKPLYQLSKSRHYQQTTAWEIYLTRLLQSEITETGICHSIFRLLADTKFCIWCVEYNPIFALKWLQFLETQNLSFDDTAKLFVGNLAQQAVNSPNSHFAREQDLFHGFEYLGNALFASNKITNQYDPLSWISYCDSAVDEAAIKRHKKAITITLLAHIESPLTDGKVLNQAIKYFVQSVHHNLYRALKNKQFETQQAMFDIAYPVAKTLKEWARLLGQSNLTFEVPSNSFQEDRNLAWGLGGAVIQFYKELAHYVSEESIVRHPAVEALGVFSPMPQSEVEASNFIAVTRARMLKELQLISSGAAHEWETSPELIKLLWIVIGINPFYENHDFGSWLRAYLEKATKYLLKNPPRQHVRWTDSSVLPTGWKFNRRSNRFVRSLISN